MTHFFLLRQRTNEKDERTEILVSNIGKLVLSCNSLKANIEQCMFEEILRNGFEKGVMEGHGVTHLDLAAHGTVSLSRCSVYFSVLYCTVLALYLH